MLKSFYSTTVGKKITMASTGLVLVGFVLSHMAGNLKIFGGKVPETGLYKFDEYAHFLREIGAHMLGYGNFLWIARAVLLVCLILHVASAAQLSYLNMRAKPVSPHSPDYRSSNAASRTMKYGGLFLFCFIIFHILHFTTGTLHTRGFVEGHVYANVWYGFGSTPLVAVYVVSMAALSLHLYHGTWSMFQTLGIDSPSWNKGIRTAAKIVSILVFLGFSSIPLAVTFGMLPHP